MTEVEHSRPVDAPRPEMRAPARRKGGRTRTLVYAAIGLIVIDLLVGVAAGLRGRTAQVVEGVRETAAELGQAEGSTALILGNLTVSRQIDEAKLADGLSVGDQTWWVGTATLETSTVMTWSAAYDQHFSRRGHTPDLVVIGFVGSQLDDQNRVDWPTIGRYHTGWSSLRDRMDSADDLNAQLLVAGSQVSALVGERKAMLSNVVGGVVPGYSLVPRAEPGPASDERSYERLAGLIDNARADGAQVAVVALPTPRSYELAEGLGASIREAGGTFVDMRLPNLFSEESFDEGPTLTPEASAELAALLSRRLVQLAG